MAARSIATGLSTGMCVTASHNPALDNGIKLSEPSGEMLEQRWETAANSLAQAESAEEVVAALRDVLRAMGVSEASVATGRADPGARAGVLVAHDTRPSSHELAAAAAAGVEALGAQAVALGTRTTPQLHWAVRALNRGQDWSVEAYYEELGSAFYEACEIMRKLGMESKGGSRSGAATPAQPPSPLLVDCANGVGAPALQALARHLAQAPAPEILLRATGRGELNGGCGADAVQKARTVPRGSEDAVPGARCASLDGDADRIVYWVVPQGARVLPGSDATGQPVLLLDGDRIAVLATLLLRRLCVELGPRESPSLAVVQTAYANGASTLELARIGVRVECTPTGVKHLHAAAHVYDVGVYFEANGHGTVLFSPAFLAHLEVLAASAGNISNEAASRAGLAARALLALSRMINQAVGDALSGLLLVEAALEGLALTTQDWAGLYRDRPSRQAVVSVPDRAAVATEDAERRVARPAALQQRVDALLARIPDSRAFVRPSGTEDVVRVYAEAPTQEAADALAKEVGGIVKEVLG